MFLLRSPMFILLVVFIALVGVFLWYRRDFVNASRNIRNLLLGIENRYADFVRQRITLSILEDREIDQESTAISKEAMTILKPEIDTLIAHINTMAMPDVRLNYQAKFFRNAVSLVGRYLANEKSSAGLSERQIEDLYHAFEDAIKADLTQRILDVKTDAKL